jgi:DNA-binding CsgD family transcriptional regulator
LDCVQDARSGNPWLVVIQGEAGIGKSALLRRLTLELEGFTVLRAVGDVTEMDLPFGVLGQLTGQVTPELRAGFPSFDSTQYAPRSFAVGARLLDLLSRLQRMRPVAMLIDDITLCDDNTLEALSYALRRMLADRVLIVLCARTSRSQSEALDLTERRGWPALAAAAERVCGVELSGLTAADVQALSARTLAEPLTLAAAERLRAHTGGHPLYVEAMLAELSHDQLTSRVDSFPVIESLSALVRRQAAGLPSESQRLLEALAVVGTPISLASAGELAGVGDPAAALGPALDSGLVGWNPSDVTTPVWISHPINRDAIEATVSPVRRRELHAAAADLVDEVAAVRHRVAASDRMNDPLAAELEARAFGQQRIGNIELAATWLEWAADLSVSPPDRERRLLTAAGLLLVHPRNEDRVARLRPKIEACSPSPMRSAMLARLDLEVDHEGAQARLRNVVAATVGAPGQEFAVGAAAIYLCGSYLGDGRGTEALEMADVAITYSPDPTTKIVAGAIRWAGVSQVDGPRAAVESLRELPDLPAVGADVPPDKTLLVAFRGLLAGLCGDLVVGARDMEIALQMMLAGSGGVLAEDVSHFLALTKYLQGRWTEATINAEQTLAINLVEGRAQSRSRAHLNNCMLAAGRGEWPEATDHLREMHHWTTTSGVRASDVYAAMAAASLGQARADYFAMLAALGAIAARPTPNGLAVAYEAIWLPWYVEASLGSGRLDEADEALKRLATLAVEVPNLTFAQAWLEAWAASLRGDLSAASQLYAEGFATPPGPDHPPMHRAALAHSYGRFLLAAGETTRAATPLAEAERLYVAMDARPFLERVIADLDRTGAHPKVPDGLDPNHSLTGRERQIAHLVARGLSNDDTAHELYLSTKTVEYHLSHIYAKLGIKGRRDLRDIVTSHGEIQPG